MKGAGFQQTGIFCEFQKSIQVKNSVMLRPWPSHFKALASGPGGLLMDAPSRDLFQMLASHIILTYKYRKANNLHIIPRSVVIFGQQLLFTKFAVSQPVKVVCKPRPHSLFHLMTPKS